MLEQAESLLRLHGWVTADPDPYDQRYYRQWMHELPPMRHVQRLSVLDVHHNILPTTARQHPDAAKLLAAAQPLVAHPGVFVLAPADMVLHSAVHLFNDGEFEHGLRDLCDLDSLLRQFGCESGFWDELQQRAEVMDLVRPLYYALRYTRRFLDTPVPDRVVVERGRMQALFMDILFGHALMPKHPSCNRSLTDCNCASRANSSLFPETTGKIRNPIRSTLTPKPRQVIIHLHPQPNLRRAAKRPLQP